MIPVSSTKRKLKVAAIIVSSVLIASTAPIIAQTATGVSSPAIQGPVLPAISGSSIAPSLPATTAGLAGVTTNLTIGDLSALLVRFQTDLEQLLPVLNSFNNSFDFVTTGANVTSATSPTGAANLASNLASNMGNSLGSNMANNSGANFATPVASGTAAPSQTNSFGFPAGLGVAPVTAETLRALLVLQSDLQRLLPSVSSLNGVTTNFVGIGLTPGFVPGGVTNVFGITAPSQ